MDKEKTITQCEELQTLIIDTKNGFYELNGRDISESGEELVLCFSCGQWSLTVSERKTYTINDHHIKTSICQHQNLTKEEIRKTEKYMERSMLFRDVVGGIIKVFVLILIVLAIFFSV